MPTVNLTAAFVEKVKPNGKRTEYFDDSLPGFALRVSESGVKSWIVFYRFGGRLTRYTFGTFPILTLKEARQKAKDALHDVSDGVNPARVKQEDRSAPTFRTMAENYRDREASKKKSGVEMSRLIDRLLIPHFGAMQAKEISRRDVKDFVTRYAEHASIAANRILGLIRLVFKWGIEHDYVEISPCYPIKKPGGREYPRERALSEGEIKKVWTAMNQESTITNQRASRRTTVASLKLRLITAQRGGEVEGMEWAEVDLDSTMWTIPAEKAKNNLSHRVPLSATAMKIILEMKELHSDKGSPYVFPGPGGKFHIANVQKTIQRIVKASGVEFRGHDLRRTAASLMTSASVPRLVVGKILNHVEPGVTKVYDRYAYDREKRDALDLWSRKLSLIISDLREVRTEA